MAEPDGPEGFPALAVARVNRGSAELPEPVENVEQLARRRALDPEPPERARQVFAGDEIQTDPAPDKWTGSGRHSLHVGR